MAQNLSIVEQDRMDKYAQLTEAGLDLYPAEVRRTSTLLEVRQQWGSLPADTITTQEETLAGRVMFKRASGKIAFATLQEGDGTRLQIMLAAQDLGRDMAADEAYWLENSSEELDWEANLIAFGKKSIKRFEKSVDLGDFVEVSGVVATSIKGELSLRASSWRIVSKSIKPLPFLHSELSDETRMRQPYAHLIQSQDARDLVRTKSRILRTVRRSFEDWDFIEIQTPAIQPIHGGAQARPFKTMVNAVDQEFSLRISLELPLKKAVVGGLEKVFAMESVFRNEGIDSTHNPEFMLLEAYEAYGDMHTMAAKTETIFRSVANTVGSRGVVTVGDHEIDFNRSFQWVSVYEGISELIGQVITTATPVEELLAIAAEKRVELKPGLSAGKIVMELCDELLEPTLIEPTFLYDWPAEAQPLARRDDGDPAKILAWDLIVNGMECATAFTELVDPVQQRRILEEQSLAAAGGDPEAMELDEDFLRALSLGAPPMGGLGIGLDRLVMLFTGANIREVIMFPIMKKEEF